MRDSSIFKLKVNGNNSAKETGRKKIHEIDDENPFGETNFLDTLLPLQFCQGREEWVWK